VKIRDIIDGDALASLDGPHSLAARPAFKKLALRAIIAGAPITWRQCRSTPRGDDAGCRSVFARTACGDRLFTEFAIVLAL